MQKNKLRLAIDNYAKAGEELRNQADLALASGRYNLSFEEEKELMEYIYSSEVNGARAEGRLMEMRAATIVRERQMKFGKLIEKPAT